MGWKDGLFVFRNETLSEIMKILGRWYGVNVIFLDDSLKELEYTEIWKGMIRLTHSYNY